MNVYLNDHRLDVDRRQRISLHDLFNTIDLDIPSDQVSVEVNGDRIEPSKWLKYGVSQGDEVRVITRGPQA